MVHHPDPSSPWFNRGGGFGEKKAGATFALPLTANGRHVTSRQDYTIFPFSHSFSFSLPTPKYLVKM
jgi:hypothetical protein